MFADDICNSVNYYECGSMVIIPIDQDETINMSIGQCIKININTRF